MAETRTPATSNTATVVAPGNGDDDDREYLTFDEWVEFFQFKRGRDSPSEARNGLLVVAVLITTATYQAVLNPPGGFWQDTKPTDESGVKGHEAGKTIFGTDGFEYGFLVFIIANTAGFFGSLFMIEILTEGFPLRLELKFIVFALIVSYDFAMVSIIPQGNFAVVFIICSIILPLIIAFAAKELRKVRILRRQGRNIWDILF